MKKLKAFKKTAAMPESIGRHIISQDIEVRFVNFGDFQYFNKIVMAEM